MLMLRITGSICLNLLLQGLLQWCDDTNHFFSIKAFWKSRMLTITSSAICCRRSTITVFACSIWPDLRRRVNKDRRAGVILVGHLLSVVFCNFEHVCCIHSACYRMVRVVRIIADPCSVDKCPRCSGKVLGLTIHDCLA